MTTADAAALLEVLRRRRLSLGVAESLTGGGLASMIVSIPGASDVFRGGVVAYATPLKHALLGVDASLLDEHGAVHPDVAMQMADGVRRALTIDGVPVDVGIATTGIAGPDSPDGQPVGTVHIAVAAPGILVARHFRFIGDRSRIRAQSVDAALNAALVLLGE